MDISVAYMLNLTVITLIFLKGVFGDCWYNGTNYRTGASFPALDGCNTCTCGADGFSGCTEIGCPNICYDPVSGVGVAVGVKVSARDNCNFCTCKSDLTLECTDLTECTGCHQNGIIIPFTGSTQWVDGCNTASCSKNGVVSTLALCAADDHYTCAYNNMFYHDGDSFKSADECNDCTCTTDGVSCTKRTCDDMISNRPCFYYGDYYCPSETFRISAVPQCNSCYCDGTTGYPTCLLKKCFGMAGCHESGIVMPVGEGMTWVDGCNTASCSQPGGYVAVTLKACLADTHYTCAYNNKWYHDGDSFKSADGCNDCTCTTDGVSCTERACAGMMSNQRCFYNGNSYSPSQTFAISALPQCDSCYCDGTTGFPTCLLKKCLSYSNAPGNCMLGCHENGIIIPFGGSIEWVDGCNTASCGQSGKVATTRISCLPEMHYTCAYNNKWYHDGDTFKSADGCNDCRCDTDGVSCTERACANMMSNQRCQYNGMNYCPSATFRISAVPECDSCFCDGTTGFPTCHLQKCLDNFNEFASDCTPVSSASSVHNAILLCTVGMLAYFQKVIDL